jgi:hypothetical protein
MRCVGFEVSYSLRDVSSCSILKVNRNCLEKSVDLQWAARCWIEEDGMRCFHVTSSWGITELFSFFKDWLCVGFRILTAVVMNAAIFWYISACSPYIKRRFGGTLYLYLQGRNLDYKPAWNRRLGSCCKLDFCAADFQPWRWRWYVPLKRRFIYRLRGAIAQKRATLIGFNCLYQLL